MRAKYKTYLVLGRFEDEPNNWHFVDCILAETQEEAMLIYVDNVPDHNYDRVKIQCTTERKNVRRDEYE